MTRRTTRIRFAVLAVLSLSLGMAAAGGRAAAASAANREVFYAATGSELAQYSVNAADASLTRDGSVTLPFAVQYVWPHPSKKFLYVAWSNGMQGDRHGVTAFRIDPATGGLSPHGTAIELRHRPVHLTVDANATHVLVAYNNPSGISVHDLKADGTLGTEVKQTGPLDAGIYAHQVRVDPAGRMAILVTRGNGPSAGSPEDPGAIKVFGYDNGILTTRQSIAPNHGYGFQSRHLDFHPTGPWIYVTLEVQSQLAVFKKTAAADGLDPKPLFIKDTLLDMANIHHPAQQAGAIHVHPNGRFVYLTNRASGTKTVDGKPIFEGGENSIAVFAINQQSGEPTLVQRIDTHGMHARTFSIDDAGRLLVAANQNALTVRHGTTDTLVSANLAVFRVGTDGRLEFVRKYDVATGDGRSLMWAGFLTLPQ
jgi:6-phosphogluconolactonase (cycloisomerase 2 family)